MDSEKATYKANKDVFDDWHSKTLGFENSLHREILKDFELLLSYTADDEIRFLKSKLKNESDLSNRLINALLEVMRDNMQFGRITYSVRLIITDLLREYRELRKP